MGSLANAIFRLSPMGMSLRRISDGVVVEVNDAFLRMVGRRREEVVGTQGVARHPSTDLEAIERAWLALQQGRPVRDLVIRFPTPGAEHVPLETSVSADAVDVDGERFALITFENVTERMAAQQAVEASEQRFRELAETIQEVFWLFDPKADRFLYLSPAFERIWGRPCATDYGRDHWLRTVHPADRERVAASASTAWLDMRDSEYRIVRPDGSVRWIRSMMYPVRDEAGSVVRLAGVAQDITERRETEQQLREAQKMESMGKLAGGVAHDFNNILTVVASCSELLSGVFDPGSPNWELVEEVRVAGERAASLTRQLLTFSRREVVEPKVLDLNALVTETEKMLRRLLGEDITVHTDLASELPRVHADGGQFVQILVNLAVNARDAMPSGGNLEIRTREVMLDAARCTAHQGLRPGRFVRVSVSDDGAGMAPDVAARVFEPFFTTKGAGRGTGLGLSVVHGIAVQNGGFVDVQSEVGHGTSFEVYFPALDAAIVAPVEPRGASRTGRGETLLLVEDDEAVRRIAAAALRTHGYLVVEASDGARALEVLATTYDRVRLVVTDVVMPVLDGRQFVERARVMMPHLRVLYTSGYTDDDVMRHGIEQHAVAFLPKPYSVAALLAKVRETLDE